MTTHALAERPNETVPEITPQTLEQVLLGGDLSRLTPQQRVAFYGKTCDSLGLNPLTKPFDYINLNGKLTLYAKRDATDQLRKRDQVSVAIVDRAELNGVFVVRAQATLPNGRTDESLGAVPIATLKGEALANALMKAETKAKRRVTLSICGLGWLDETEVDSIPSARRDVPAEGQPIRTMKQLQAVTEAEAPTDVHATVNTREIVNTETGEVTEAPPPPTGDLPPDTYYIADVQPLKNGEKNGRAWMLFGITTTAGETYETFDQKIALAAETCRDTQRPARIVVETKTLKKGGTSTQIVEFQPVIDPAQDAF